MKQFLLWFCYFNAVIKKRDRCLGVNFKVQYYIISFRHELSNDTIKNNIYHKCMRFKSQINSYHPIRIRYSMGIRCILKN